MNHQITAFLHLGDWFMPKSFARLPEVGDLVDAGVLGNLRVTRIEYDAEGDAHLYLDSTSS